MPGRERDKDGYSLGELPSREVGKTIRGIQARKKLKLVDLHNDTGIPLSHLSDLLSQNARRRFQRWQVVAIARALGMREAELLPSRLPAQLAVGKATLSTAEPTFASLYEAIETWSEAGGDHLMADSEFVRRLHEIYSDYKKNASGQATGGQPAERSHK